MASSISTLPVNPLNIAEIVGMILEHLYEEGDWDALFECAQVNNIWEREAVSLLWHVNQPGQQMWSALAKMQKYRRQNYTSHIRHVDDERFGEKNHTLFSSLKFPRLEEACFKMLDPAEEMHRLQ